MNYDKTEYKWWHEGLGFGLIMFVCMGIVYPLIDSQEITVKFLLLEFLVWMIGGVLFGFINGLIRKGISRKKKSNPPQ